MLVSTSLLKKASEPFSDAKTASFSNLGDEYMTLSCKGQCLYQPVLFLNASKPFFNATTPSFSNLGDEYMTLSCKGQCLYQPVLFLNASKPFFNATTPSISNLGDEVINGIYRVKAKPQAIPSLTQPRPRFLFQAMNT